MKYFITVLLFFFLVSSLSPQKKVEEKKIDILKEPKVTLETPYYKITIKPEEIKKAGEYSILPKNFCQ